MKFLIFNLKAKLNYEELDSYVEELTPYKNRVILAPSYLYLEYFLKHNFILSAQDTSAYPSGNFTGEVSAEQLRSIGCKYVLIGHYERRKYLQETNAIITQKIKQALKYQLTPIVCLSELTGGFDFTQIKEEINEIFGNLTNEEIKKIILAYEPSLMISTNKEIDKLAINKMLLKIKDYVRENYQTKNNIIYGGSINLDNIKTLNDIQADGFLIGDLASKKEDISVFFQVFKQ